VSALSLRRWPIVGLIPSLVLAACSDSDGGPANTAPVAVVHPVVGAVRGDTVLLDGTGSSDADGDSLSFAWTMLSRPVGSSAELLSSDIGSPAFVADLVGTYQVSLVVNDGHTSSGPDQTSIAVTVPGPRVTIDTPSDAAILTSSPVSVTGTVTDAEAVTLNGVAATVDGPAGTYTASLPLTEGGNLITAVASNGTGTGQAEITVILNTANTPVVTIAGPRNNSLTGHIYLESDLVQPFSIPVKGVVRVYTMEAVNTPTVTVAGVPATVGDTSYRNCPAGLPQRCFKFSVTLSLSRGKHTLWAVATDVLSGKDSSKVALVADYAYRPTDQQWTDENKTVNPVDWTTFPNLAAVLQPNPNGPIQNVRSQEIDGCSAPTGETHRNDPMTGATQNQAPTAFGAGTQPPSEFRVYGQPSAQPLPCNKHDVCYQTVGSSRATCDDNFYAAMRAVCAKAYPAQTAAYLLLHPIYKNEQSKCYNKATTYYDAVRLAGQAKFNKRQAQHTYSP